MNYIYTRISTDGQNETSFQVQEDVVRKQLAVISTEPITVIQEVGSGKNTENRPKFVDMLSNLKQGDIVGIYDNSRFSRDIEISLQLLREIHNKGARLLCDGKFINPDNPQDKMIFSIQSTFSTYQRDIQNQKSLEGIKKKYSNGDAIFSPILGYEVIRRGKNIKVEIVPEEANVVQYVFTEYSKGKSLNKLAEELYSSYSKTINNTYIRSIISRSLYMGYYPINRKMTKKLISMPKEEVEKVLVKSNYYPPIISEQLWWDCFTSHRVCKRMKSRPFDTRFTVSELSGIYVCPDCRKHISFCTKNRKLRSGGVKSYPEYVFNSHTPDCKEKLRTCFRAEWLINISRICFFITFSYGNEVGQFFEEVKAKLYSDNEQLKNALDEVNKLLAENKAKADRIVIAISNGILDMDMAKGQIDKLKQEKAMYETQKANIQSDLLRQMNDLADYIEVASDELLANFDLNRRRNYLTYVKEGLNFGSYLTLEFMNGKMFKIYRAERTPKGVIKPSEIEVSYQGEKQLQIMYDHANNKVTILPETTGDKDADLMIETFDKDLENKINYYITNVPM